MGPVLRALIGVALWFVSVAGITTMCNEMQWHPLVSTIISIAATMLIALLVLTKPE